MKMLKFTTARGLSTAFYYSVPVQVLRSGHEWPYQRADGGQHAGSMYATYALVCRLNRTGTVGIRDACYNFVEC
jgi:hypothetical protein